MSEKGVKPSFSLIFLTNDIFHYILIVFFEIPADVFWYFKNIWSFFASYYIFFDILDDRFFEDFTEKRRILSCESTVKIVIMKQLVKFVTLKWSIRSFKNYRKLFLEIPKNEVMF